MLKIYCPEHPKYDAKSKPTKGCFPCEDLWHLKSELEVNSKVYWSFLVKEEKDDE